MHAWTDVSPVGFSKITSWSWCDWVIRSPWMIASLSVDLHCTTNFWISSMYNNYKWMNYWIEHECPIFCLLAISTTCTHKWRSKWRGRNVKKRTRICTCTLSKSLVHTRRIGWICMSWWAIARCREDLRISDTAVCSTGRSSIPSIGSYEDEYVCMYTWV